MTSTLRRRELAAYAWPIALSSVGSVVIGVFDTFIMGRYSTESLAGVGLGASIYELPLNALLGGLMAYAILAPRAAGAEASFRAVKGLSRVLRGLFPYALMTFVALLAVSLMLKASDDTVLSSAGAYLLGRSPSLLAELLSSAFVTTLVVWGYKRVPLVVFAISCGTNITLGPLLVYGPGPVPELGALGDGLSSFIAVAVAIPWLLMMVRRKSAGYPDARDPRIFDGWKKLTVPAVASAIVDYSGNLVFTLLLSLGGAASLAGARLGAQTHLLVFVVIASLSSAGLVLLGRAHGADGSAILAGVGEVRRIFVVISGVVGAIVLGLAWPLPRIVSPDGDVHYTGTIVLVIVGALCPIAGYAYANITALRVLGKTSDDFKSNALAVWVAQIPIAGLGLWLAGGEGAFSGLLAYWAFRAFFTHRQVSAARRQYNLIVARDSQ